jgi:integrase/recombinase XerD
MGVSRLQLDEAAEAVVDAYRNYELTERRLGELTVINACYLVRKFLAWRAATGHRPLERLDADELQDYVRHEAGRLRIGAVRQTVAVLRTFTRFLFATGITSVDLTGCVPSVSGIRFDGLPKAVDRDLVRALLASCAVDRPVGRRDYAILLLMVRLGLRAVEIARMQLGDIDWRSGVIEVRARADAETVCRCPRMSGRRWLTIWWPGPRARVDRCSCRPPTRRSGCHATRSCSCHAPRP